MSIEKQKSNLVLLVDGPWDRRVAVKRDQQAEATPGLNGLQQEGVNFQNAFTGNTGFADAKLSICFG